MVCLFAYPGKSVRSFCAKDATFYRSLAWRLGRVRIGKALSEELAMWEPQQADRCYRHSGRVPGKAFVGGLAVAVGLGLLAGGVFGYLELFAHLIPIGK